MGRPRGRVAQAPAQAAARRRSDSRRPTCMRRRTGRRAARWAAAATARTNPRCRHRAATASDRLSRRHQGNTRPVGGASAAPKGRWRSQAAKDLLAPVKPQLIATGILETLITLLAARAVRRARRTGQAAAGGRRRVRAAEHLDRLRGAAGDGHRAQRRTSVVAARGRHAVQRNDSPTAARQARPGAAWMVHRSAGRARSRNSSKTTPCRCTTSSPTRFRTRSLRSSRRVAVLVYLFVVDWRLALILLAADPDLHPHDVDDGVPERPEDHRGIRGGPNG